jgi:hypothetical protein
MRYWLARYMCRDGNVEEERVVAGGFSRESSCDALRGCIVTLFVAAFID